MKQTSQEAICVEDDPVLLRIPSLGELSPDERLDWIEQWVSKLRNEQSRIEKQRRAAKGPFMASDLASAQLHAKLQWLLRLRHRVLNDDI